LPVRRIEIDNPSPEEAVDVTASASLKEKHRKYGDWMKKLAGIVKKFYSTKGNWQALWTIATRVFGLAYHGHSVDVSKALARELAGEMNIDPGVAEDLVEAVYKNLSDIVGEKRARGQAPESVM